MNVLDLSTLPTFISTQTLKTFEALQYYKPTDNISLLSSSSYGDSTHLSAPIALVNKRLKTVNYIEEDRINKSFNDAFGVFQVSHWLLIVDEYPNVNVSLYDLTKGKEVLSIPNALDAVLFNAERHSNTP